MGFELSEATVAKYIVRHRKPPSQTWRPFLPNQMKDLVSSLPAAREHYCLERCAAA
jgi:hypothetical protein